jgi:predicted RecB family nuclease
VLLYAELLARAQGAAPEHVTLALGGLEAHDEHFRVADYAACFRSIRGRFLDWVGHQPDPSPAPDPVPYCDICAWRERCDAERRAADHLSLVAGISAGQRRALVEGPGITTLEALATLPLPLRPLPDGVSDVALERIRAQARIQAEGRRARRPLHELIRPVLPEQGLATLPPPTPGDLFLDLESDAYALTYGLEYLFGFTDRDGRYTGWWALNRA